MSVSISNFVQEAKATYNQLPPSERTALACNESQVMTKKEIKQEGAKGFKKVTKIVS